MDKLLAALKRNNRLYELLRYGGYARLRSTKRERIFTDIYERNLWNDPESQSGPSSSLGATQPLRAALPELLRELAVRSLLDAPCGDLAWMQWVPLGIDTYVGADIVQPLIERNRLMFGSERKFVHLDLLRDRLPGVDAVLCRDFLEHLSLREVAAAIENIRRAAPRYFLATTFPHLTENRDTVTPYWRGLNLQLHPFNFPPPIRLLKDFSEEHGDVQDKFLGVWEFAE